MYISLDPSKNPNPPAALQDVSKSNVLS